MVAWVRSYRNNIGLMVSFKCSTCYNLESPEKKNPFLSQVTWHQDIVVATEIKLEQQTGSYAALVKENSA